MLKIDDNLRKISIILIGGREKMKRNFMGLIVLLMVCGLFLSSIQMLSAQTAKNWKLIGQYSTISEYERISGKKITKFSEAPVLAELVKQGKLPPVEKRLPEEPLVVEPLEEIGKYGGTARVVYTESRNWQDVGSLTGEECMFRIARDGKTIIPNIAKKWKLSSDAKTLTIYLRKGIKWSDGQPFTADDIMFWYEDVLLNDELTPVKPTAWAPGGKLVKIEKLDEYTVRLQFAESCPVILTRLAHNYGNQGNFFLPKHYLKQFHPRYTPKDQLEKLTKQEGFDYWYQLFGSKSSSYYGDPMINPDIPVLRAFKIKSRVGTETFLERNPFYWKVDTEGNQLPYIDRIYAKLVESVEVFNMKVISGEADFAGFSTAFDHYPVYKENEEKSGTRVLIWNLGYPAVVSFHINLTHKDPVMRKIFQDKRFRIALSIGMNREEINQVAFLGYGTPMQLCVIPKDSKYYVDMYAKAYTKYDPVKANRLLDEIGLKKGPDGWRLRPDGKPLQITVEFTPAAAGAAKITICEMVQKQWEKLGLKVVFKQEDRQLYMVRCRQANEHDIGLWHADMHTELLWETGSYLSPIGVIQEWAPLWSLWYTSGGKAGEEPPAEIKRIMDLYKVIQSSTDKVKKLQAAREIWRSNAENLWAIGTIGLVPQPIVVNKRLRNIPEKGLWTWDYFFGVLYSPEQYFFK
ncbi:MAG: ABC transporter substrate-binding protein [archaeon YNP-WB-062]|jgi:peptide/nickel transport system substrate-binding protein|nr:ABC transporter substrate-binding protein [Candidatus Culexarchaeum yellowstonense]